MTIHELYDLLGDEIKLGKGDLPIVLECDHSQTPMSMTGWGDAWVEDLTEYMKTHVDEEEVADGYGEPCYVLQAY